ncbi:hypothetical protein ACP4OV_022526 [Aristida adscensionis]
MGRMELEHDVDSGLDLWACFCALSGKLAGPELDRVFPVFVEIHEFVDLLLGFLTHSGLRTLAAPPVSASTSTTCTSNISTWHSMCPAPECWCSCASGETAANTTRHSCDPELVEDRTYIVDDDLCICQACAASLLEHWFARDYGVVSMDITVVKQEAVTLLQAAVKTAVTDAFARKLQSAEGTTSLFIHVDHAIAIVQQRGFHKHGANIDLYRSSYPWEWDWVRDQNPESC